MAFSVRLVTRMLRRVPQNGVVGMECVLRLRLDVSVTFFSTTRPVAI